ncbi:hypothetical protein DFH06DRAFT_1148713 [Mycena polygramma]|nr:hypothetical protein DFH06DRAFT_1148713 [Mycena polygramma]
MPKNRKNTRCMPIHVSGPSHRGQDDTGTKGMAQGELALPCRACPHPDINLPEGWDKIDWDSMDENQAYKYFEMLSADANFKLINRNVSSEDRDPVVDDGAGYFANRVEYSAHIRQHVDEEEISSCSGFQALFLANAKRVKGLRVTGVAGVTCARHNMWRANGLGDLQAGERHCNMDFLFFGALLNFAVMYLILSYDIVCQYSQKIWTRMKDLPSKYHLKIDTDNEFLNGIAASTKLMGIGARAAALEGLFGFHNWRRLVAHRLILKRRMAEGIKEGRSHKLAFEAFNNGLMAEMPEQVESWKTWVEKYEREQHGRKDRPDTASPYEYEELVTTLKDVRLKLMKEEYGKAGDGSEVEREDTPSTFLSMGIDIEEAQRQLAVHVRALGANPTTSQQFDILKQRTQLRLRITAFRKLQGTYMPNLRRHLTLAQKAIWDADDKQPEATRLFMPSAFETEKARLKACAEGLDGVEAVLRSAEAGDALEALRDGLRLRTATTKFKIRNWSGQRALTRGQGILRHINLRIHAAKLRYMYTRQTLLKLKGHGDWEKRFQVLTEDDVRALNERALTAEEKADRARLREAGQVPEEGGIAALGDVVSGETHRTLSWIWYTVSGKEGDDEKLHEALRVEWCKAYSRSRRWREELVLVEEEMRRTIGYGDFMERRWKQRSTARTVMLGTTDTPISPEVAEGVRAYALEQADRERRTSEKLRRDWGQVRAAAYLRGEDISGGAEIVVDMDRDVLRWAEALAYEQEEVENDMYSY